MNFTPRPLVFFTCCVKNPSSRDSSTVPPIKTSSCGKDNTFPSNANNAEFNNSTPPLVNLSLSFSNNRLAHATRLSSLSCSKCARREEGSQLGWPCANTSSAALRVREEPATCVPNAGELKETRLRNERRIQLRRGR